MELETEWRTTVETVRKDLLDLAWQREQMDRIMVIVNSNPLMLSGGNPFPWDLRRWYMVFSAMAVRRQTDKSDDVHSLRGLLKSLRDNASSVTRDLVLKVFTAESPPYGDEFLHRLVDNTWAKFSTDGQSIDVHLSDPRRSVYYDSAI